MPGLFDSIGSNGGILGMLTGHGAGPGGLAGTLDPNVRNFAMQQQQQQATYQALAPLIQQAYPDLPPEHQQALARAATLDPEIRKQITPNLAVAPQTKQYTDQFGGTHFVSERSGLHPSVTELPIQQPAGSAATNPNTLFAKIDEAKANGASQEDLLKMIPPESGLRNVVSAALTGGAIPTQYSMRGQNRDNLLKLAHAIDENMNEQELHARQKVYTDLNSNSPSSLGGMINRGRTAFKHLANLGDYFTQLGNNPGYEGWGGSAYGKARNYLANNEAVRSPEQGRVIMQANDQGLKYGQESTAYITQGKGGTEAERTSTLRANNAVTGLPQEQAGYLIAERKALLDKTEEFEDSIRRSNGQGLLDKKPIRNADFQASLKKLDAAIAKLDPAAARQLGIGQEGAPQQGGIPQGWNVRKVGQ